jgi:hypothetical protein
LDTNSKKITEIEKAINDNQSILVLRPFDQSSKITADVIEIIEKATMEDPLLGSRKLLGNILDEDDRDHESDKI